MPPDREQVSKDESNRFFLLRIVLHLIISARPAGLVGGGVLVVGGGLLVIPAENNTNSGRDKKQRVSTTGVRARSRRGTIGRRDPARGSAIKPWIDHCVCRLLNLRIRRMATTITLPGGISS